MKEKEIIEIEPGNGWWIVVSFSAGCFGFGWIPFIFVFVFSLALRTHDWRKK